MKNILLFILMILTIGVTAQIPTNGLVLEYTFDGGSTNDTSSNGNNSPLVFSSSSSHSELNQADVTTFYNEWLFSLVL